MARWWKETGRFGNGEHSTLLPSQRYYVHVCSFTFVFGSLAEIPKYIEHYQTKILPSSRMDMSKMPPRHHWEAQCWHETLPLRLREEGKRQEVVKALTEALADFRKREVKKPGR